MWSLIARKLEILRDGWQTRSIRKFRQRQKRTVKLETLEDRCLLAVNFSYTCGFSQSLSVVAANDGEANHILISADPGGLLKVQNNTQVYTPTCGTPAVRVNVDELRIITAHGATQNDVIDLSFVTVANGFDSFFNSNLQGREGADTIFGSGFADSISSGESYFVATNQHDLIFAGAGNDTVDGGQGSDTIYGEDGDDWISGGVHQTSGTVAYASDVIYGGAGDDLIWGDAALGGGVYGSVHGRDAIFGGDGNDGLSGWNEADFIHGGAGSEDIYAEAGDDTIVGGAGDDGVGFSVAANRNRVVSGGVGNDVIHGDGVGDATPRMRDAATGLGRFFESPSNRRLDEASGAIVGRRNPGTIYSIEDDIGLDGGTSPALYANSIVNGASQAYFLLANTPQGDWEDLAYYRENTTNWLYIADTGAGNGRNKVSIYRVVEPSLSTTTALPTSRIDILYPSTKSLDAEALFVDSNGDIYAISKQGEQVGSRPHLYRLRKPAASLWGNSMQATTSPPTFEDLGELALPVQPAFGQECNGSCVSAADISPDGLHVLVQTDRTVYLFSRPSTAVDLGALLTSPDSAQVVTAEERGNWESIAWKADGTSYFRIAEWDQPDGGGVGFPMSARPLMEYDFASGEGNDVVEGNDGNDTLYGDGGDDRLAGETNGLGWSITVSNDRYVFRRNDIETNLGSDQILDRFGTDSIDVSQYLLHPSATLSQLVNLGSGTFFSTPGLVVNRNQFGSTTIESAIHGAPAVSGVFVSSSAWQRDSANNLVGAIARPGLWDPKFGYAVPSGSAQTKPVGWDNIDTLSIRFSEPLASMPAANALIIDGSSDLTCDGLADVTATSVTYDPVTYTVSWKFNSSAAFLRQRISMILYETAIKDAYGFALNGEWVNPATPSATGDTFPSGDANGTPGGQFLFNVNMLRADVNQDGKVALDDGASLQARLGQTSVYDFRIPFGSSSPGGDINGNGPVDRTDAASFARSFGVLGAECPVNSSAPAAIVSAAWQKSDDDDAYLDDVHEITGGSSSDKVEWFFDYVPPGEYRVAATWTDDPGNVTNAVYAVYDGATLRGTDTIDQTAAPNTTPPNGEVYEGAGWEFLLSAPFDVASGVVKVTLDGNAGGRVVADAVRLIYQGALTKSVSFSDGALLVEGTDGNDTIAIASTNITGTEYVTVDGNRIQLPNLSYVEAADVEQILVQGRSGDDSISLSGVVSPYFPSLSTNSIFLFGGVGNDTIVGSDVDDLIEGGEGNDSLDGGTDSVGGGGGDDTYLFSQHDGEDLGADTITEAANSGSDTLDFSGFGAGASINLGSTSPQAIHADLDLTLSTSTGIENVIGSAFDDTLTGNARSNLLDGGSGEDHLNGGVGYDSDTLRGGAGADTYYYENRDDTVSGMAGADTIDESDDGLGDLISFRNTNLTVTLNLSSTSTQSTAIASTVLSLTLTNALGIEDVIMGDGNNVITGNARDNSFFRDDIGGVHGSVTLSGGEGDDLYQLAGQSSSKTVSIVEAADQGVDEIEISIAAGVSINLGSTSSQSVGGNLSVTLSNATGIENLVSTAGGADTVTGNSRPNLIRGLGGNDTLTGGSGEDTLEGGQGNDSLVGGVADDTYLFARATGNTTEDLGSDTLVEDAGGGVDTLDFGDFNEQIIIYLSVTSLQSAGGADLDVTLNNNATFENVLGTSGDDYLYGNASENRLVGNDGYDTLEGRGGRDVLEGGADGDTYLFIGTSDLSDDELIEQPDAGYDTLSFDDFDTSTVDLSLSTPQVVRAGVLQFTLNASEHFESIDASLSNGPFAMVGNDGVNVFSGSAGNDTIQGGDGTDSFLPNGGNDSVLGGDGNDVFHGGVGDDTFAGGAGDDFYWLGTGGANHGSDTIVEDADVDADVISLSLMLAAATINLGSTSTQTVTTSKLSVTLSSTTGIEHVIGTNSADSLTGNSRANTLEGGLGNDTLVGGIGDDTYIFSGSSNLGTDTITEAASADVDTLDFSAFSQTVSINTAATSTQVIHSGKLSLALSDATGIENLIGSEFADNLSGNSRVNHIWGLAGNDTISGHIGNDTLEGEAGADSIDGSWGNDVILGGDGDDPSLTGSLDDDWIDGGRGNDTMIGNSGNDTLVAGIGNDSMNGSGSGTDIIEFGFTTEELGTDTIVGTGGTDVLDFSAFPFPIQIDLSSSSAQAVAPNLTIQFSSPSSLERLVGTALGDQITGNSAANSLSGGAGDDTIIGATGNDTLVGGDGNDVYSYSGSSNVGTDTVTEAADLDEDRLDFTAWSQSATVNLSTTSSQVVYSGLLTLVLSSATGIENATGSASADSITGNARDNVFEGLAGNDTLAGSTGSDRYVFSGATNLGTDTITEAASADADVLDFSQFSQAATVSLSTTGNQTVNSGELVLNLSDAAGIESIIGTQEDDLLWGNSRDNYLYGDSGEDTIYGGSGDDTIEGGASAAGYDWLEGEGGDDTYLFVGSDLGSDHIAESANQDSDTLDFYDFGAGITFDLTVDTTQDLADGGLFISQGVGSGIENVIGTDFADSVTGNDRDNRLEARGGDDTLSGGNGDDTYVFGGSSDLGIDDITEAATTASDTLDFSALEVAISVDAAATGDQVIVDGHLSINLSSATGIENVVGTLFADELLGNDRNNSFSGLDGDDTLTGVVGADTLAGGDGADLIEGGAGNDSLDGGGGDDVYRFESGGALGTDTVTGDDATDVDTLDFADLGYAATINLATTGSQTVNSTNLSLNLTSGTAVENVVGSAYADTITGNSQDNLLSGAAGADTISASTGDDSLEGGLGSDSLTGGSDDDVFLFAGGDDLGTDTIVESATSDSDTLDLSEFEHSVNLNLATASTNQTVKSGKLVLYLSSSSGIENAIARDDGVNNTVLTGNTRDNLLSVQSTVTGLLLGDSGNDTLVGGIANDVLYGGNDDDQFFGGEGDDSLYDSAGNDYLFGDAGNDLLELAGGVDTAVGGSGDDTYQFTASIGTYGSDTVVEAADMDQDTITFAALSSAVTIDLTSTSDQAVASGASTLNLRLASEDGIEHVTGTTFADSIEGDARANLISGEGGADTLVGGDGEDTLSGGAGNDSLDGGEGDDTYQFAGGAALGTDSIVGDDSDDVDILDFSGLGYAATVNLSTTGNQTVNASNLTINLASGTAIENVFGSASADTITGNSQNNVLTGNAGADTIDGGSGNDSLSGGAANDSLVGGAGDDTFQFVGNDNLGTDTINEAATSDSDTLDFTEFVPAATVSLASSGFNQTVASAKLVLYLTSSTGIENVFLGEGGGLAGGNSRNNLLVAGNTAASLNGAGGNDTLVGGDGNDTLQGSADDDSLVGNGGDDVLSGADSFGYGDDTLVGGSGDDYYSVEEWFGGPNHFVLVLSDGSDDADVLGLYVSSAYVVDISRAGVQTVATGALTIDLSSVTGLKDIDIGASSNGTVIGNNRDNVFRLPQGGSHEIRGGAGDDTYEFPDTIPSGLSIDIVEAESTGNDTLDFSYMPLTGQSLNIDLGSTGDQSIVPISSVQVNLNSSSAIERVVGSSATDTIVGNSRDNYLFGGGANDTLYGSFGDDTLEGGANDDRLVGGEDDDTYLFQGATNLATDTVFEQSAVGSDVLDFSAFGQAISALNLGTTSNQTVHTSKLVLNFETNSDGIENVIGSAFADSVTDNSRGNQIDGGAGDDTLIGGTGDDTLSGGDDEDSLVGGDGNDLLQGGAGDDTADGGNGEDRLSGDAGNDSLLGGAGDDSLEGGEGDDALTGGDDDDTYVFAGIIDLGSDTVTESADDDSDTLDFSAFGFAIDGLLLGDGTNPQTISTGMLTLTLSSSTGLENVIGTSFADNVSGNTRNNVLYGMDGDDTLTGGTGDDVIAGGAGADSIHGGDDDDVLIGDRGRDSIFGEDGNDTLWSGSGESNDEEDTLDGGIGTDLVDGNPS